MSALFNNNNNTTEKCLICLTNQANSQSNNTIKYTAQLGNLPCLKGTLVILGQKQHPKVKIAIQFLHLLMSKWKLMILTLSCFLVDVPYENMAAGDKLDNSSFDPLKKL
ncbi:hypothetical protein TorRG33x02_024160 [Trema orientale]|uniref:Uncharacterized protein n=1 Tax=Trema orientale TaxID=63057 RepID=A0A2P5FV28_TREOI|nr:hypothetical protein TorRG33x02_024160 [Trema orientale]